MWLHRFLEAALLVCGASAALAAGPAGSSAAAASPQGNVAPPAPPANGARILLLPRQLVAGERATLAVLDVNGRLTPGVAVTFSNGDRLKTDATGRALFVAPLTAGVLFASIEGRAGRVTSTVLTAAQAAQQNSASVAAAGGVANGDGDAAEAEERVAVSSVPRVTSITDRFDIVGRGFCGDADANHVSIGGQPALVLASSPMALVVLPPAEAEPGSSSVAISCAKHAAAPFAITLVELALEADSSPLAHGEHRALRVAIKGSAAKLQLEARNLAPDIADLTGGNPAKQLTSGGADNAAKFEVVGKKKGSFLISIRLVSSNFHPTSP